MAPLVVEGQGAGRQQRRRVRRARLADRARRRRRARSPGARITPGPDKDVLIGPNFKPFYAGPRGKDLGVKTLAGRRSGRSAAAPCGAGSPTTPTRPDLLRHRESRALERRPAARRQQMDLHASSRAARTPARRSGPIRSVPHDDHDYDGVNENILLDLNINGQLRKVLAHPDRNGDMYIIDRATGEVISAEAVRVSEHDRRRRSEDRPHQSHRGEEAPDSRPYADICPAPPGAKDWQPSAFSPKTGLLYIPHNNLCYGDAGRAGELHRGHAVCRRERQDVRRARAAHRGEFSAWDPVNAKEVWTVKEKFPAWSGARRHGGRRRLLRHDGRLVQGARRPERQRALAIQGQAPGSSASRSPTRDPTASSMSRSFGRRRMGRRGRRGRLESGRRHGGARLRQRHGRSAASTRPRAGCFMSSRCLSLVCALRCARHASAAGRSGVLRVCADPNNLPFSNERAKVSRTGSPNWWRANSAPRVEYTWWAAAAGASSGTR